MAILAAFEDEPDDGHTESSGTRAFFDDSDRCGPSFEARLLTVLRALVRERVKVYGAPLPDGFVLPDGITLEMLLSDDPKPKN
jgi:hypothetical protein